MWEEGVSGIKLSHKQHIRKEISEDNSIGVDSQTQADT